MTNSAPTTSAHDVITRYPANQPQAQAITFFRSFRVQPSRPPAPARQPCHPLRPGPRRVNSFRTKASGAEVEHCNSDPVGYVDWNGNVHRWSCSRWGQGWVKGGAGSEWGQGRGEHAHTATSRTVGWINNKLTRVLGERDRSRKLHSTKRSPRWLRYCLAMGLTATEIH